MQTLITWGRRGAVAVVVVLGACGDDASDSGDGTQSSITVVTVPATEPTGSAPTTSESATDSTGSGSASLTGTGPGTTPTSTGPDPSGTASTAAPDTTDSADTTVGVATTTGTASSSTGPDGPLCGNSLVDPGEECDDGNDVPDDSCSNECTDVPCDQQSNNPGALLSFIWIANSAQGTVSKIDTKTGVEHGRYYVQGGQPSRTSVNLLGDVAVSSRDPGGVTKIAARKEKCIDKNGNGMIETSTGPADILPFGTDECILWTKSIPSTGYGFGPRATAWEPTEPDPVTCQYPPPRLWFGWMDANYTAHFERVDGETGATLDTVMYPWASGSYSPYGGAVNANGDFFATGLSGGPVIKIDADTLALTDFGIPPNGCKYGMTLDIFGNIWVGGCGDSSVYHYDTMAGVWSNIGNAGGSRVNGIMADKDGNVWGAGSDSCRLVHIDAASRTYINNSIPLPGCSAPWGVSIDIDGFVWVVDMNGQAYKVDPVNYATVITVSGLVGPYTYSDMTGAALAAQVVPQ
jgi:cysteine-rich repeat protein